MAMDKYGNRIADAKAAMSRAFNQSEAPQKISDSLDQFTAAVSQSSDRSVHRQMRRAKDRLVNGEVEKAARAAIARQTSEPSPIKPKPRPKRRRKRR